MHGGDERRERVFVKVVLVVAGRICTYWVRVAVCDVSNDGDEKRTMHT